MVAALIFRSRFVYADGTIREMVLWKLPRATADRPHGLKYRFYYGSADGRCLVRYDNERGKGDHRHAPGAEEPYEFGSVEKLVADFLDDIAGIRRGE